ncbi:Protein CBG12646 [Caenorhabditis briggsae]|uniref:Protein CBG12646 n=1 Tax=Caenorhabditis briggsae TaxID=6238 RepID=A8XG88_CAEBR|nr:Protein CBG12646 [Caenorhabditis briggsae]CAP31594.1 Protein CBG12646 [Caenorhabditis briggsae]
MHHSLPVSHFSIHFISSFQCLFQYSVLRSSCSQKSSVYWNQIKYLVFGIKMVVDYATDLLSLDIYGLLIDENGMWAFDCINDRQEKLLGVLMRMSTEFKETTVSKDGMVSKQR